MTSFSVATISAGKPELAYVTFMLALVKSQNPQEDVHLDQVMIKRCGPYLDTERHRCVEWFLNTTTSDYLLFIDDDVAKQEDGVPVPSVCWELVRRAAEGGHKLASGIYFNFFDVGKRPVVYETRTDEDDNAYFDLVTDKQIREEADDTGAFVAGAVGAGFMAIHRSLLIDMIATFQSQTPTFVEMDFHDVHLGEDLGFCARAIHLGHPPVVFPIYLDHHKTSVIRGDDQ